MRQRWAPIGRAPSQLRREFHDLVSEYVSGNTIAPGGSRCTACAILEISRRLWFCTDRVPTDGQVALKNLGVALARKQSYAAAGRRLRPLLAQVVRPSASGGLSP
jgi:hypothetical protein